VRRAPALVPALLRFSGASARQDAWGRLLRLNAGGAELSTAARLTKGERLVVGFELGGERLAVSAAVDEVDADADGQTLAVLSWHDLVERRRLSRALADILSRA
jgi:hypothetical protein